MDDWTAGHWLVALGYLAGGLLPLVGFVRAKGALQRAAADVERRRVAFVALQTEDLRKDQAARAQRDELRGPWSYEDLDLLPLIVRAQLYAHALADLRGPALWVLAGVAAGTAASIGSLLL